MSLAAQTRAAVLELRQRHASNAMTAAWLNARIGLSNWGHYMPAI
jgi:hypothetical protein